MCRFCEFFKRHLKTQRLRQALEYLIARVCTSIPFLLLFLASYHKLYMFYFVNALFYSGNSAINRHIGFSIKGEWKWASFQLRKFWSGTTKDDFLIWIAFQFLTSYIAHWQIYTRHSSTAWRLKNTSLASTGFTPFGSFFKNSSCPSKPKAFYSS